MSDRRDMLWFKTTTTLQSGTLATNALKVIDLPANSTYITLGAPPVDAHMRLIGHIEHITIHSATSTARNIDIAFFSGATAVEATGAADRYIDHESFVANDWWQIGGAGAQRTSRSGLMIPYQDRDGTKKFHIGIINRHTSTVETKVLVVEFSWRADRGEP